MCKYALEVKQSHTKGRERERSPGHVYANIWGHIRNIISLMQQLGTGNSWRGLSEYTGGRQQSQRRSNSVRKMKMETKKTEVGLNLTVLEDDSTVLLKGGRHSV